MTTSEQEDYPRRLSKYPRMKFPKMIINALRNAEMGGYDEEEEHFLDYVRNNVGEGIYTIEDIKDYLSGHAFFGYLVKGFLDNREMEDITDEAFDKYITTHCGEVMDQMLEEDAQYLSDEGGFTRKTCSICKEARSCGNYNNDKEWVCEPCEPITIKNIPCPPNDGMVHRVKVSLDGKVTTVLMNSFSETYSMTADGKLDKWIGITCRLTGKIDKSIPEPEYED